MEKWFVYSQAGTKLNDQPENGFQSRADAHTWAISQGYKRYTVQRRD